MPFAVFGGRELNDLKTVLVGIDANTVTTGDSLFTVKFDDHPSSTLPQRQLVDRALANSGEQSNTVIVGNRHGYSDLCLGFSERSVDQARPRGRQTDNWRGQEDNHER